MQKGSVQSSRYTLYYEMHGEGLPVILLYKSEGMEINDP